jgi:hypothetical protein
MRTACRTDRARVWRASACVRLIVALLALPMVLSAATAAALFRCNMVAGVHAGCCCPMTETESDDTLERASCCERIQSGAALPPALTHDAKEVIAPPALIVVQWVVRAPREPAIRRHAPSWERPAVRARAGPSLVVLHQRFLI